MSSEDSCTDYSSSSSSSADDNGGWPNFLKCYVCCDVFKKPRILPCGHTFCANCLIHLRDAVCKDYHSSHPLGHRRGESGVFTCPMPDCDYSMKAMNICRWSLKNRTAADAASQLQRRLQMRRESTTQTDICLTTQWIALPQIFNIPKCGSYITDEDKGTSLIDLVAQAFFDIEEATSTYIPRQVCGWRSIASMLGMSVLLDVLK